MSTSKFQRLFQQVEDSDVYVSYGESRNVSNSGESPRVILLLGWMEARPTQLYRFAEMYRKLYPSATQILIRTYRKSMFVELPANKRYVLPAVKLLHDAGVKAYDPPASSGLLVHCMSNGGAMALTYLAYCLVDTHPAPSPDSAALPAQALIYDSVPGAANASAFFGFYTTGITSPSLRLAAKVLLIPAYVGTVLYTHTIDRRPDTLTTLKKDMSDGKLLPQTVPHVFIYGDADDLTIADSVEKYTAGLKKRLEKERAGANEVIAVEKYVGSPHMSHAKNDPRRYWDAVVRTWVASLQGQKGPEIGKLRCKL